MLRKSYNTVPAENLAGGTGKAIMHHWLADEEKSPNFPLACTIHMEKGATVGDHVHTGEAEIYRVISGKADYNDNGTTVEIGPGDVVMCYDGEMHGIVNTGDGEFVFDAIIVKG